MAAVWARAEVVLEADGRKLPAQVYKYAKEAGDQGGEGLEKEFDKHLTDLGSYQLNRLRERTKKEGTESGRLLGTSVSTAFEREIKGRLGNAVGEIAEAFTFEGDFDRWAKGFDSVGDAAGRMKTNLQLARDEGRLSESQFGELNKALDDNVSRLDDAAEAHEKYRKKAEKTDDRNGRSLDLWHNLSNNTRQWTLIIGSVIGGMGELSTLASAAGGGILLLGGALAEVGVGFGAAIAASVIFMGDIANVPDELKPARKAFDDFKGSLTDLADTISIAAFKDSAKDWDSLKDTVNDLTPVFSDLGDEIGDLFHDFAEGIKDNRDGLKTFVSNSTRLFGSLIRTVGRLGEALLDAFNNKAFQNALDKFSGWLGGLVDGFASFVNSEGFTDWINNTVIILGSLNDLLGTAGDVLKDLVDKQSVDLTKEFLDNLTKFLDGPGRDILDFAKQLDVFGLIAQGLADFGTALAPLGGPMKDFAAALNGVIQSGIGTLAPIIGDVAKALAPFVQALADFMKQHPKEVADGIIAIGLAFATLKAAKIATAAADLLVFSLSVEDTDTSVRKFDVGKLKKIGSGLAGIGLIAAGTLIPDDFWKQFDIQSNLPNTVLTGAGIGAMFGGWGALIGAGIGVIVSLFTNFKGTLNDLGPEVLTTLTTGPWAAVPLTIAGWFTSLVPKDWLTSDNPLKAILGTIAFTFTDFGTAIGKSIDTWKVVVFPIWNDFWGGLPAAVDSFGSDVETNVTGWFDTVWAGFTTFMGEVEPPWNGWWGTLPQAVNDFGASVQKTATDTWTNISNTFTTVATAVGSGWNTFWGGLPAAVNQFGVDSDKFVNDAWTNISGAFTTTISTVTKTWNDFWGDLPDKVNDFGKDIETNVKNLVDPFNRGFQAVWTKVTSWVDKIADKIRTGLSQLPLVGGLFGGNQGGQSGGGGAASGRIVYGGQRLLVGEAGPEAIVPLHRPLSRVDPSVRALSAVAQGMKPMASGGIAGVGRSVVIGEGAVQVFEAGSARQTAYNVLDVLANRIAG